jgi:hypothetical protein
MTVAEQAAVTEAPEACGQAVAEDAADELSGGERHDSRVVVVARIPPAAREVPRFECA